MSQQQRPRTLENGERVRIIASNVEGTIVNVHGEDFVVRYLDAKTNRLEETRCKASELSLAPLQT